MTAKKPAKPQPSSKSKRPKGTKAGSTTKVHTTRASRRKTSKVPSSPASADAQPAEPSENGNGSMMVSEDGKSVAVRSNGIADLLRKSIARQKKQCQPDIDMDAAPEPEEEGLAGDQVRAFRLITARLRRGDDISKLCGYAGTGKTFLLARLAKWAKRQGYNVTIAAPTHKAAGVIQQKLGEDIDVRTIHSLLGMTLVPDMEHDTGGHITVANTDAKSRVKDGLVICDEASMIGSELKAEIDKVQGVRWLFVGDLAQLPPVGESVSELLDDPDATLEQVLRQKDGSEILALATAIRGGDKSMRHRKGRDVDQLDTAEQLFQAALDRFRSPQYQEDACHARMLVFKNSRRKAINQRMRSLLIDSTEPYVESEWLVMYAAFCPEKSRMNVLAEDARSSDGRERSRKWAKFFEYKKNAGNTLTRLHVSEEVRVVSAEQGTLKIQEWEFAVHRLKVQARGETFDLPVLTEEGVKQAEDLKAEAMATAHAARKARDEYEHGCRQWADADQDRKDAWSLYFTLDETFAQVDYAYAMTVHKSQGSTFDHAFVDVPDLLSSGGMQQRILYTACTRPAQTLTFYV